MSDPRKIYWDSSCFLCLLNPDETVRRAVCDDVLRHADLGDVEIWISTWVIVEVIRPKKPGNAPLPEWATKAIKAIPDSQKPIEELWYRFQASPPAQRLTPTQIAKIQGMFQWPFLRKIYLDERIAHKAVELARDYGLKPADSVHAASAILTKCDVLQKWDRDYDKIKHLIAVEEPQMISQQHSLTSVGLTMISEPEVSSGIQNEKAALEGGDIQAIPESSTVQTDDSSGAVNSSQTENVRDDNPGEPRSDEAKT